MSLTLNLTKSAETLQLCLQKKGVTTPPSVDLAFLLDVSGSFEDEHESGITNDLMTRLVPWGITFDPDRKLDVITFSNGRDHVANVGPVTETNYNNFIRNKVINKVPGWSCGTDYSYAIEESLRVFGWLNDTAPLEKKTGFFGKLFGKQTTQISPVAEQRLALSFIITDGANSDQRQTEEVIQASQDRGDKVYFIFIGISNQPGEFRFIDQLGKKFPNVGFLQISNLKKFVGLSDEELNEQLVTDEFISWLKQ